MRDKFVKITKELKAIRFPDAHVVFLAGSIIRGEETPSSDVDLVVLYQHVPSAYRESFYFQGFPVECFVHDPETLNYFFYEIDRVSGYCSLANMVLEGIEIPKISKFSQAIKQQATLIMELGPLRLSKEDIDKLRYDITNLIDDLRHPRNSHELMATGTALYEALANYCLRANHQWAARGKAIPRALQKYDPALNIKFNECFARLIASGQSETVIALSEELLKPNGGFLFEGHKRIAPEQFRKALR